MKKFMYPIIWAAIVLACVIMNLSLRASIHTVDLETLDASQVYLSFYDATDVDYPTMDELTAQATHVVSGISMPEKSIANDCTLSAFRVEQVHKGDMQPGEHIYVYEQSFYMAYEDTLTLIINRGQNLMIPGRNYVLFLTKQEFSPEYRQNEKEKQTYILVEEYFSKLGTPRQENRLFHSDESDPRMREADFITGDQDMLDVYVKMQTDAWSGM